MPISEPHLCEGGHWDVRKLGQRAREEGGASRSEKKEGFPPRAHLSSSLVVAPPPASLLHERACRSRTRPQAMVPGAAPVRLTCRRRPSRQRGGPPGSAILAF